jgi:sugar phosphate isomerase/epimerase
MNDLRVGVNLPGHSADPRHLDEWLRAFAADGFDCVEISLDTFPFIIGGKVARDCVEAVRSVLARHRLAYSAHVSLGVDLRDTAREELQRRVLAASIEVCGSLGADPLVLHYELASRDARVEERFLDAHREAAEAAARLGLRLCIENIEVELVEPVVRFVRAVDRPNFRMCFDAGHAFLASRYFHFDFLEALRAALPLLGHVHLNDNTGDFEELRITDRPTYNQLPMGLRRTFGRGDIHLPPFWGSIPFEEVFALLREYLGMFVCEYTAQDFTPFNRSVQEKVRKSILAARTG